jgi:hypothetical protein
VVLCPARHRLSDRAARKALWTSLLRQFG